MKESSEGIAKKYILFDHDGVLVETEQWFYLASKRALAPLGIDLPLDAYLVNMANGVSAWEAARVSGVSESEIERGRELRNRYYQEYLTTKDIEIEGVLETLDVLAGEYRMGIVTTSKPPDFALIHEVRSMSQSGTLPSQLITRDISASAFSQSIRVTPPGSAGSSLPATCR